MGFLFQPLDLTSDDLDSINQGHDSLKVAVMVLPKHVVNIVI